MKQEIVSIISTSAISGCVSIPVFASIVGGKICGITAGIKKYQSIIKKLNYIEVFISKPLIDSYINHDEFVSVDNVLRNILR